MRRARSKIHRRRCEDGREKSITARRWAGGAPLLMAMPWPSSPPDTASTVSAWVSRVERSTPLDERRLPSAVPRSIQSADGVPRPHGRDQDGRSGLAAADEIPVGGLLGAGSSASGDASTTTTETKTTKKTVVRRVGRCNRPTSVGDADRKDERQLLDSAAFIFAIRVTHARRFATPVEPLNSVRLCPRGQIVPASANRPPPG